MKSVGRRSKCSSLSSPDLTANDFSNYFSSVFQENTSVPSFDDLVTFDESDFVFEFNVLEVEMQLQALKPKSCGPEQLPIWVFRLFSSLLAPAVTALFNRCLSSGIFPSCLKMANVIPIPKCNN